MERASWRGERSIEKGGGSIKGKCGGAREAWRRAGGGGSMKGKYGRGNVEGREKHDGRPRKYEREVWKGKCGGARKASRSAGVV